MITSLDLIKIIGSSPFLSGYSYSLSDERVLEMYDRVFQERVALLYLTLHRRANWSPKLENLYQKLENRRKKTLSVISEVCGKLNAYCPGGYVVFKSIRPYPATPNDTDILFLGNQKEFLKTLEYLYNCDYQFHEEAPLQITIYDPRGKGKIGPGKLGGTYYIDCYQEISTDYYVYINKAELHPFIKEKELMGNKVKYLQPEPELAIVLFHNVFPEKTFQLEHFYMPLYYLNDHNFNIDLFINFVEEHRLVHAVKTNLSLVEYLHEKAFRTVPALISELVERWGKNHFEVERFSSRGSNTPYLLSGKTFWKTFAIKSMDSYALKSLIVQGYHMLHPTFLSDVISVLKRRFSKSGVYHLE